MNRNPVSKGDTDVLDNLGRYRETEEAVENAYEEDHITITRVEYNRLRRIEKESNMKAIELDMLHSSVR
jgi:hypothetical protein